MASHRRSGRFLSRLPIALLGSGLAVFLFYFVFLRGGKPSSAEAASTPPVAAPETPPAEPPKPEPVAAAPEPVPAPQTAPPTGQAPPPASPLVSLDRLIAEEKFFEARGEIAPIFATDLDDATRASLAARAVRINHRLLVTHPDPRDVEVAEILQGENPTTFCRRFKTLHGQYGVLQLVNNIRNVHTVRAGRRLRVPKGSWSLFVDKSLFTLYLLYRGTPYKTYPVCIGVDDKTPAAAFVVGDKNPKPAWYAPPEWLEQEQLKNPIPYGHPKNPLGEYWIALEHNAYAGYGIHGTNEPRTLGTRASNGCVRMLNDDVVELARVVWKGMDVVIVD